MAEHHVNYAFGTLLAAARDATRNLELRPLPDALAAFDRLRTSADHLGAHAPDGFFPRFRYTSTAQDRGRGFIHFQGVQRLRDGRHALVSGGDSLQPAAHLFVIEMGSRYVRGPWGSNLVRSSMPPHEDTVVEIAAIARDHWHAGGFTMLGDVAVVPLELPGAKSRTVFVDFADPLKPRPLPIEIIGPSEKAGAASLVNLPGGRFLCLIYRDEKVKKNQPTGFLDFYLSRTTDLCDGFAEQPFATVHYAAVEERGDRKPGYQTVQFLTQGDPADPRSWSLFLAGTWNGSSMSPTLPGPDWADLHTVTLDARMFEADPPADLEPPRLRLVRSRRFTCRDCFGNFDAAAGFHVDESGRLGLYSAFHWRYDDSILLAEFRETVPADAAPITAMQDAWVELYEHTDFAGRRLTIVGNKDENLTDYDRIHVQGATFNDIVSSARWQIPQGRTYRLYADAHYADARGFLDLDGTGTVGEIRNFKKLRPPFNDRVSSSRYI